MAQKYIVTSDGELRYGDVGLHRYLLNPGEHCIGGGFYEFGEEGTFNLYGRSYDFGRPIWERIDRLRLPASLAEATVTYEDLPIAHFVEIDNARKK